MPILARPAHDAEGAVAMNEHVAVGRGDVNRSRLIPLAILTMFGGQIPYAREEFRKNARRLGGNVDDNEDRCWKIGGNEFRELQQRFNTPGRRPDDDNSLRGHIVSLASM